MTHEELRDSLLSHAVQAYEIGYLLLDPLLVIQSGNRHVNRWVEYPLEELVGSIVTNAFPELIGVEDVLVAMAEGDTPFRLEEIFRLSADGLGAYFDLQIIRLGAGSEHLLLTTADVTNKARQEMQLQQQRNEVQILSAELSLANERLSYILNRLVPRPVAQQLLNSPRVPQPGGEMLREATILFADMRDFTAFAEVYQPLDTLEFLNTYLAVVAEAILRHEGNLVQLVGDMIMGVFNIPEEQFDHPMRAIRAAIDIQESLRTFNSAADGRFPDVAFGVGISTGPVIAGYMGFHQRFRYAVVGDATNVAFHLSSIAAPGRILLSESTVLAGEAGLPVREKGDFQLKRRRKLVKVYELIAIMDSELPTYRPST